MTFKIPKMPSPRRDEPTPFEKLPREVQDAYILQRFGGGLSAGVARSFLLFGEGGDVNPPDNEVAAFAGRGTVTFERGAPIRGEGGRFGGSEPGTKEEPAGGVAKVSDVVDSGLRKGLGKQSLMSAPDQPALGPTPRNKALQEGIDNALGAIDEVHGMPAETGVSLTFHALSGNASAEGTFVFPRSGDPEIPTMITVKNGDSLETSVMHEVGHYLDYSDLGTDEGQFGSGSLVFGEDGAQVIGASEFMAPVMDSVLASPEGQQLTQMLSDLERTGMADIGGGRTIAGSRARDALRYVTDPRELFARAYAQFVATEAGSDGARAELTSGSENDLIPYQWAPENFGPIGDAIRGSLDAAGLLNG